MNLNDPEFQSWQSLFSMIVDSIVTRPSNRNLPACTMPPHSPLVLRNALMEITALYDDSDKYGFNIGHKIDTISELAGRTLRWAMSNRAYLDSRKKSLKRMISEDTDWVC